MPLPAGYSGVVISRREQEPESGAVGGWAAQQRFESLHHWNHDTAPQKGDPLRRCLDWAALAQQLHQPVAVAAVDTALLAAGPPQDA